MGDSGVLLAIVLVSIVLIRATVLSGCTSTPGAENLTKSEIAYQYLLHSGAITSFRSEYNETSWLTGETRQVRYDYRSPMSYRVVPVESSDNRPGSFWVSNGTTTASYDAKTGKYDIGITPPGEQGWQAVIRHIVSDGNFTVRDRSIIEGMPRYTIDVATPRWSEFYSRRQNSWMRAVIEPQTGLAWNITVYKNCSADTLTTPTLPPGRTITVQDCNGFDRALIEIRYEWIQVNTVFPEGYFDFVPPPGSVPRCDPKYVNYVEPPGTDPSVPINEPVPGGIRYSLNKSDSGKTITIRPGDVIEITLPVAPSLDIHWLMPMEGHGLELLNAGGIYHMTPGELEPSGVYRWRYRAVTPGTETIDGIWGATVCDIPKDIPRFFLTVNIVE